MIDIRFITKQINKQNKERKKGRKQILKKSLNLPYTARSCEINRKVTHKARDKRLQHRRQKSVASLLCVLIHQCNRLGKTLWVTFTELLPHGRIVISHGCIVICFFCVGKGYVGFFSVCLCVFFLILIFYFLLWACFKYLYIQREISCMEWNVLPLQLSVIKIG